MLLPAQPQPPIFEERLLVAHPVHCKQVLLFQAPRLLLRPCRVLKSAIYKGWRFIVNKTICILSNKLYVGFGYEDMLLESGNCRLFF